MSKGVLENPKTRKPEQGEDLCHAYVHPPRIAAGGYRWTSRCGSATIGEAEAEAIRRRGHGPRCAVCVVCAELSPCTHPGSRGGV